MDPLNAENRQKRLSQIQEMQDEQLKVIQEARDVHQLMRASMMRIIATIRAERLKKVQTRPYTTSEPSSPSQIQISTLKVKRLHFPLLWNEELKKKENTVVVGFFVVACNDEVQHSDLIETVPLAPIIRVDEIKLPNVAPDDFVEIIAYFGLLNLNSTKHLSKYKDSESGNAFLFKKVGIASVRVQDLLTLTLPIMFFELLSEAPSFDGKQKASVSLRPKPKLSNNFGSRGNIGRTELKPELSKVQFFGQKLHHWNKASATFSFCPEALKSKFAMFSCEVNLGYKPSLMCLCFEGSKLNLYDCLEIYMSRPTFSLLLSKTSMVFSTNSTKIELVDEKAKKKATVVFKDPTNAAGFAAFFRNYLDAMGVWGLHLDAHMDEITAYDLIKQATGNPSVFPPFLWKQPLEQIAF